MSKILNDVNDLPHVFAVDDERNIGNGIIITLQHGWCFVADPGCAVRGFDNVSEVKAGTLLKAVYRLEGNT